MYTCIHIYIYTCIHIYIYTRGDQGSPMERALGVGWGGDVSIRCDVDMEVDASHVENTLGWGGVGMLAFVVKLTRPLETQKKPDCQTSSFLRPGKFIANNSTKLTTSKITQKTQHL